MSYRIEFDSVARKKIKSWDWTGRYDFLLVDIELRVRDPCQDPARLLRRAELPFEGMVLEFAIIDPLDRMIEHRFAFLVLYSQDEQTLIVANAGYTRRMGLD